MKVFVSHGTADLWVAKQIARCIGDLGVASFLDAYDVAGGDDIEARIWEALRQSDELVVLLTPFSKRRGSVWMEIGAARVLQKRVCAMLYGLSVDDIVREEGAGFLLRSLARDLNDIPTYFDELRGRKNEC